jgi:hypothetical protein
MRQQHEISKDWNTLWSPREYLNQYYRTPVIPTDELAIFGFMLPYLRKLEGPVPCALDFGVGPTLHHEIALVPFAQELHLADYIVSNFSEIQKWLDNDAEAHNWDTYVKGILELEGQSNVDTTLIESRKALLRRRITKLFPGNVRDPLPLGFETSYPLVTSFYAAETVASNKQEWQQYMRNLSGLVAPNGILIISVVRQAEFYQVGDYFFPSANLNERDVSETLRGLGFDTGDEDVIVAPVEEWGDEGFNSIIVARGRKRG